LSKNYYNAAIILYALQLVLLVILVPGNLAENAGYFAETSSLFYQIIRAVILILCICSFFLIRQLYVSGIKAQKQKIELLKLKNLEEQNLIYRQHRHDLYNHMTVISGLAQLGKLDGLKRYLDAYIKNYSESLFNVDTGLKEVDVLFYAKISKAKSLGIDVQYSCQETLLAGAEQVISLVTILANALDNAIEAAARSVGKKLAITIRGDLTDYIFEIANTYRPVPDLEKKLQTEGCYAQPEQRRGHGIGIMRRTVRKLQGNMAYDVLPGTCRLTIELPKIILGETG